MRRIGLILLLLYSLCLLTGQTTIDNITVNGENLIVTRVVISLAQKAVWSYQTDTDKHVVSVHISNCNSTQPQIEGLHTGTLVTAIETTSQKNDAVVAINLSGPFYIETLFLDEPYKIVLDLFKYQKVYNYQDQLAQAAFYVKSGKWYAAGKQYAQIRKDFPSEFDANYLWAKLLLKQHNFEKAKAKLEAVPSYSKYYAEAQATLTKLNANTYTYTEVEEPEADKVDTVTPANPRQNIPKATSTVVPALSFNHVVKATEETVSLKLADIPVWAWFLMLLVVLIACFIILDILHHQKAHKERKAAREITLIKDDSIKAAMVRKLIENGWNETEIARELMLKPKDVKRYAKTDE